MGLAAWLIADAEAQRKPTPAPATQKPSAPAKVAQTATTPPPVGNPIACEFEFTDWMQATGYQLDIIDATTMVVQQTLRFNAVTALPGTNTIRVPVNVQPVAHGLYAFVARAVLPNGTMSPSSEASDPWQRLPGPPGKPVALSK
jgi:hypothetical protein